MIMDKATSMAIRERRSDRGKRHWARCKRLAVLLGCSKQDANLCWSGLIDRGLVVPEKFDHYDVGMASEDISICHIVLAKNPNTDYARRLNPKKPKGKVEKRTPGVRSRRANFNEAIPEDPKDPKLARVQRVKCAMWLIEKCGSVEKAQDAMDRAKVALK